MKTIFPFTLEIDEESFKLSHRQPKKAEVKEIQKLYKAKGEKFNAFDALSDEIKMIEVEIQTNKELISCLAGDEKIKLLKEQKKLITTLGKKRAALRQSNNEDVDFEDLAKKRFDLCVFGEDKVKLEKTVEEKGITYLTLIQTIDQAVESEKAKK